MGDILTPQDAQVKRVSYRHVTTADSVGMATAPRRGLKEETMSDQVPENQPPTEPAPAPAAPDEAAIEAARKLLTDAGHEVIPTSKMKQVKEKAAEKAAKEAADAQKALEAAEARATAAEEALKAKQQEGLSDAEKVEQAAADLAKAQQAHADAQSKLQAENEALQRRIDDAEITRQLGKLLSSPFDAELAEMRARANIKGLGIENGDIVLEDHEGNKLTGDEAREWIAKTWWLAEEQKKFRAANAPGPGTTGGGKPAPTSDRGFQVDPKLTHAENLKRAREYNKKHGIRPGGM